ncbi:MAG: haloacid dehalogenase-like hydrolase [Anaerolineae bacterium]|nr:haloacid dehalogenase-like hydrolase [Anaerolineae bacterium]
MRRAISDPVTFLPGTRIELIDPGVTRGRVRHALFDFDGTISLIRQGWQDVMIPMMVELLLETPGAEDEATLVGVVRDYVTRLTGRQTIYQMIRLDEEVEKRGGRPLDPLAYKRLYHDRLWRRIEERVADLEAGRAAPDDLMVPGSRSMLEGLRRRGVRMYLASGTDEVYVRREAALLDLPQYFEGVYGALDDYWRFSKRLVIQRIIGEHGLAGPEFAAFGDGYVEIEDARAAGGIAVGVASDEARRQGVDEWKRQRLIDAGAHLVVPDFREHEALVAFLLRDA